MPLPTTGTRREALVDLSGAERDRLLQQHVLVTDPRRWRPRWFDGRFLAASDLQSEQNQFLVRNADLGRACGSGVVDGLMVSEIDDSATAVERQRLDRLQIEPGLGVTDTGELVSLAERLLVEPANIPEMQRLDAAFGLQILPNEPGRTRTGVYVLALRPVEWTAQPVGAYPTTLTGKRSVQDSTIVEGVAISLIPYPDPGQEDSWRRRRAQMARDVFVEGLDSGRDSGVLPIAVVALRGNLIEWVDPFLVRRETGSERPAGMDFGFGARALREAHLLQYQRHLADALNAMGDRPFPATAAFDALPPVGQFPAGTLDPDTLTQRFFPPGLDVELAFVPEDELPAVIEESLLLPPLDLRAGQESLEGVGVIVLVPLPRPDFNARRATLPNWDAELPRLRPAFTRLQANTSPRDALLGRFLRPGLITVTPAGEEEPWRRLLREALGQRLLWYVRRRHLPIPANVAGTPVRATHPAIADRGRLVDLVRNDEDLASRLTLLRELKTPEVNLLSSRLAETRFVDNPALLKSVLAKAVPEAPSRTDEAGAATIQPGAAATALGVTADPRLGEGLLAIKRTNAIPANSLNADKLAETGLLVDIDTLAREVPAEKMTEFSRELKTALSDRAALPARLTELRGKFITS